MSTFTMDDFEGALRHSVIEPHCQLLAEVHATLIYNLRTVPFNRHSAITSLLNYKEETDDESEYLGVTIDQLIAAMADVGNNWERAPLRHTEGREGWEESMVGCLKDVSVFRTSFQHGYLRITTTSTQHWKTFLDSGKSSLASCSPLTNPRTPSVQLHRHQIPVQSLCVSQHLRRRGSSTTSYLRRNA